MNIVKEISKYFNWDKKTTEKALKEFYEAPSIFNKKPDKDKILEICLNNKGMGRVVSTTTYLFEIKKVNTNQLIKAILNSEPIIKPINIFNFFELTKVKYFSQLDDIPEISRIDSLITIPNSLIYKLESFCSSNFLNISLFNNDLKYELANLLVMYEFSEKASEEYEKVPVEKRNYPHDYGLITYREMQLHYFKLLEDIGLSAMYIPFYKDLFYDSQNFTKEGTTILSNIYSSLENPLRNKKELTKRRDNFIFLLIMNIHIYKGLSKNKACKIVSEYLKMHNPTIRNIFWDLHKEYEINENSSAKDIEIILENIIINQNLYGITVKTMDKLFERINKEAKQ